MHFAKKKSTVTNMICTVVSQKAILNAYINLLKLANPSTTTTTSTFLKESHFLRIIRIIRFLSFVLYFILSYFVHNRQLFAVTHYKLHLALKIL